MLTAPISEVLPNPGLMRSLGRLVRGLSALFWGLPVTLVICFHTARAESLKWHNLLPPVVCTGLLLYGLILIGAFQKQERVWRNALDLARILALINCGLSPFLYFWNKMPDSRLFTIMIIAMTICGLCFLGSLNWVLRRLGAMIPDEALRLETKQFTVLNLNLLGATLVLSLLYLALSHLKEPPLYLQAVFIVLDQGSFWLIVLLVLLPMAMTMALLWKTKEVILENVFGFKPTESIVRKASI
jgi:hypothetical protein